MPQGTDDFVEDAAQLLRDGGHKFLLVALHDRQDGQRRFNVRSYIKEPKDLEALRDIIAQEVPAYLDDQEKELS